MGGARTVSTISGISEKRQAPKPPQLSHTFQLCSLRGDGGRAAATFGAEQAVGEGSPNGRTSKALRCSARRRRTGHEEQSRSPSPRSEEHTSELQSLMRISYAVFCL